MNNDLIQPALAGVGDGTMPAELSLASRLGLSEAQVHDGTKGYDLKTRGELLWFFAHASERGWKLKDAADAGRVDRTVLTRVWRGEYRNPKRELILPEKLMANIRLLRENEEIRLGRVSVGFVETQSAGYIFDLIDAARRDKATNLIYGPSHSGKTWALMEAAKRRQGVFYVRVPVAGNLRGLVKAIATAIGIQTDGYTHEALKAAVTRRLNDTNQLLIDEAHDILTTFRRDQRVTSIEWLRALYDDGRGPSLIICGTPVISEAMERGVDAKLLEQFAMRTMAPLNMRYAPSPKDVSAIIEAYGFPAPKGEDKELVASVVATRRLKGLTYRLSRALAYATEDGVPVSWKHFRETDSVISAFATGKIYTMDAA